jgi:hypothetical protein
MEVVLAGLAREWGSAADYLRAGGMTRAELDQLVAKCVA